MPGTLKWQPSACIEVLKKRSGIIKKIRAFFFERHFIEVDVPLLALNGVTDPYNENIVCNYLGKPYYLQTSPEYHLKRLLCAGSPDLFQLAKAFRHEPHGRHHNPEFTMLEWYRLGWDYQSLMTEVITLIQALIPDISIHRYSYQSLFQTFCNFDPFSISCEALIEYSLANALVERDLKMDKDAWLSLIMGHTIEPKLEKLGGCSAIYDFPKSQASLAVVEGETAKRFEIYLNGIELANGFQELRDPMTQQARFEADNAQRLANSQSEKNIDPYFMSALKHGLPQCSGVALGIDRLIMAVLDLKRIEQVISFPINRA